MLHLEKIVIYNIFILSIVLLTAAIPHSPNTENIEHLKGDIGFGTYLGLFSLFSFFYIALLDFYFPGTGTFLANQIVPYFFAFCKWFCLTYIAFLKQAVIYTFALVNWLYSTFVWLEPWKGMDYKVFFAFFFYTPWAVREAYYYYYPTLERIDELRKCKGWWDDPLLKKMGWWAVFYWIWDYIFSSIFK